MVTCAVIYIALFMLAPTPHKMAWADRVTESNAVNLHKKRWALWNTFLQKLSKKKPCTIEFEKRIGKEDFENEVIAACKEENIIVFTKCTLSQEKTPCYVFDAGFGSMKTKSDLDVSVTCKDTGALEFWIQWISKKKECMSQFWDTNFYYEKGVVDKGLLIPWNQKYFEQALQNTATVKDIINYTEAYRHERSLMLDGVEVYPNPANLTKEREIKQYETVLKYANSTDAEDRIKLQKCKPEGLLHVASLGIVGVYGKAIQEELISKSAPTWRIPVAIEMLCNLRMHAHEVNGKLMVKTKYVRRLDNALKNSPNACKRKEGERRRSVNGIEDKRENDLSNILGFVNQIVGDELNGIECTNVTTLDNLDMLINKLQVETCTMKRWSVRLRF